MELQMLYTKNKNLFNKAPTSNVGGGLFWYQIMKSSNATNKIKHVIL